VLFPAIPAMEPVWTQLPEPVEPPLATKLLSELPTAYTPDFS